MSTERNNVENMPITTAILRIVLAIVASTIISCCAILCCYFGIKGHDDVQDLEIEYIKLQQSKTDIELKEIKLNTDKKQDKK